MAEQHVESRPGQGAPRRLSIRRLMHLDLMIDEQILDDLPHGGLPIDDEQSHTPVSRARRALPPEAMAGARNCRADFLAIFRAHARGAVSAG